MGDGKESPVKKLLHFASKVVTFRVDVTFVA